MKHLGDITKIHGDQIEPVDCITFGSPCQGLSIAGRRAGFADGRSGLFVEAVRIIKEMRKATNGVYPTFAVWENVPGAFSSNGGEDFRAVLEELARVEQPDATIPRPPRGGRWSKAGAICGNGWSLAWRQLDAQYWGVPQRRKRIALVADFRGQRAAEILFERTSLSGNLDTGIPPWQSVTGIAQNCTAGHDRMVGGGSYTLKIRSGCAGGGKGALVQTEKVGTLSTLQDQTLFQAVPVLNDQGGSMMGVTYDVTGTLRAAEHGHQPIVFDARGNGDGSIVPTITGDHESRITDYTAVTVEQKCFNEQSYSQFQKSEQSSTLKKCGGGTGNSGETLVAERAIRWIVRRLTPTECERLQGYPEIIEMEVEKMTKDEYIALNIATGQIVVDCEKGEVYTTKGPGGIVLNAPKLLKGTTLNGYRVVSIRNGDTKMQCRVHRIVWIAQNGIIPDGFVVDHINNCKEDNRICNLQLLTAKENSHKAKNDGLYKSGNDNPMTILPTERREEIQLLYGTGEYTIRQLAKKFGISKSRVQQIVHIKGWTDIGEWTDTKGKKHKLADTPRYKALGNSIALPQWFWIAQKMKPYLEPGAKLGSLFDGIGGFCVVWEKSYGKGTARWASEIEEFPIAVTKRRFGEE